MHANLPDIAKRWERDYAGGGIAELNQELNSLPAYYLPKNQGGRIGYEGGLKVWGKSVKEQWDNLNEDQKKYIRENFPDQVPEEAAHGGLIPAHEAGIYGLAEGGKIIDGQPHQLSYITPGEAQSLQDLGGRKVMTSEGIPAYPPPGEKGGGGYDAPSPSSTSGGNGGYQTVHDTGAITQTPGRTTTTTVERDDGDAREKYISEQYKKKRDIYAGTDSEEQQEIDKRIALRRLQQGNISKQERKNLEVGLGFRDVKPKSGFWGTLGNIALSVIPGLLPAKLATTYRIGKLGWDITKTDKYDRYFDLAGINKNDFISNLGTQFSTEEKLRAETKKLQEALPKNHPESIALEAQKKTRTLPTDTIDRDGKDVNIKYTSEEITDTNDAKADIARLEQEYLEMDEASEAALLRQREMEAKRQAYLRSFRRTYMSAQGGRVPAGYNTGGLSNLFKLKNV